MNQSTGNERRFRLEFLLIKSLIQPNKNNKPIK
jgi:hypothetical protein